MGDKRVQSECLDKNVICIAFVIISLLILTAYSNTFYSPPVLDDFHSIVYEPLLKTDGSPFANWLSLIQTKFSWKRWVPMMTFSWDLALGEGDIFFLHLTNILIHLFSTLAVAFLVHTLFAHASTMTGTREMLPSPGLATLWVSGLWALHPLQTNAVTYLVQRMASLVTFFTVLTVAFYIQGRVLSRRQGGITPRSFLCHLGSAVAMMLAFSCKENSLMIPCVLLCTEAWFFQPKLFATGCRFLRKHRVVSGALLTAIAAGFAVAIPDILAGYTARHFTLGERLLTEARIIVWYLSLLLWPDPTRLSLEHDIELSTSLFSPFVTLPAVMTLMIMIYWAVSRRKEYPIISYGIIWFLIHLVVESSIIPLELIFEHRLYMPSIGIILSIIAVIQHLLNARIHQCTPRRFHALCLSALAMVLSLFTSLTFYRNIVWHDAVSLNTDNVAKAPRNPRAHANLAIALARVGAYEAAIREAQVAIDLGVPGREAYCEAANAMILSHLGMKRYEMAIEDGERLLRRRPERSGALALPSMHFALAIAHKELEDFPRAYQSVCEGLWVAENLSLPVPHLQEIGLNLLRSVTEQPGTERFVAGRGNALQGDARPVDALLGRDMLRLGLRATATRLLANAVAENPEHDESRRLLESIRREDDLSQQQAAKWSFSKKYVERPFSRFNLCMAGAYVIKERRWPEPWPQVGEFLVECARTLQPDSADACLLKGWYLYERHETEAAVDAAQRALELDPQYAKGWLGLAFFQTRANRLEDAAHAFRMTLELYPRCPKRAEIQQILAVLGT